MFILLAFLSTFSLSDALAGPKNFYPEKYLCWYDYFNDEHSLAIEHKDDKYSIEFRRRDTYAKQHDDSNRLAKLSQFLEPLGEDQVKISAYTDWDLPLNIPEKNCKAKTFESKFPEELSCETDSIDLKIIAHYKIDGKQKSKTYEFPASQLQVETKAMHYAAYKGAEKENGLQFAFKFGIVGKDKKIHTVSYSQIYPANRWESTESAGNRHAAECTLTALDDLLNVGLEKVISLRK